MSSEETLTLNTMMMRILTTGGTYQVRARLVVDLVVCSKKYATHDTPPLCCCRDAFDSKILGLLLTTELLPRLTTNTKTEKNNAGGAGNKKRTRP